jgi:hypothetical protein
MGKGPDRTNKMGPDALWLGWQHGMGACSETVTKTTARLTVVRTTDLLFRHIGQSEHPLSTGALETASWQSMMSNMLTEMWYEVVV